jgi:MamI restriction endonuclease
MRLPRSCIVAIQAGESDVRRTPVRLLTQPDSSSITISHTKKHVAELLDDLFVKPRFLIRKWAEITHQTSQAHLAYPSQHLASVVTGVKGMGAAARGEDLVDSSEVKSCSRADQLGICKGCETRVQAAMEDCPDCHESEIERKDDSHWIISIRREEELRQLIEAKRLVLVMFDRTAESRLDIRVRVWEVWPDDERCGYFDAFITDYYNNNYLAKRAADLDPAPCNLHPLKFDHLMMNPVKVLDAHIDSPERASAKAHIDFLFKANGDRGELEPERMPASLLQRRELEILRVDLEPFESHLRKGKTLDDLATAIDRKQPIRDLDSLVDDVPWQLRRKLPMRKKRIKTTKSTYKRRRSRP